MLRLSITISAFVLWVFISVRDVKAQRDTYELAPINYSKAGTNDRIARLKKDLDEGKATLEFDDQFGYLPDMLRRLEIPVSSQTLVFSKTSLQLHRISPRHPRALYFNDDIYVGYCHNGDVLEIAATDPKQGAIFYTLKQDQEEIDLVRDSGNCLSCHASHRTQDVPGYLMRSVFPDRSGRPILRRGTFTTDQRSEMHERWGGWLVDGIFVDGDDRETSHLGNRVWSETDDESQSIIGRVALDDYPSPHSDVVALMVLAHQTQMHNALAALNFETRRAVYQSFEMNKLLGRDPDHLSESARRRINSAAENVVEHLLMVGELELSQGPISGPSDFAAEFQSRGKTDSRGRSLRSLDLRDRLFRYPCSFLIHSDAYFGLPPLAREQVVRRMREVLKGSDRSANFSHLTTDLRRDILEILQDTHADF